MEDKNIRGTADCLTKIPLLKLTARVDPDRIKRYPDATSWTLLRLKYENCSRLLQNDFKILKDLESKQDRIQLPHDLFEVGMKLHHEIVLKGGYWLNNKLWTHLMNFKSAFPNINEGANRSDNELKLPSIQWLDWIIYLVLRDALRLAEVILGCEKAVEFWRCGSRHLTSSAQETPDSNLMSSRSSRIWYLASVMLEELDSTIYPFLFKLTKVIQLKDGSTPWPFDSWRVPYPVDSLLEWVKDTFKGFEFLLELPRTIQTLSSTMRTENPGLLRMVEAYDTEKATGKPKEKVKTKNSAKNSQEDGVVVDQAIEIRPTPTESESKPIEAKKSAKNCEERRVTSETSDHAMDATPTGSKTKKQKTRPPQEPGTGAINDSKGDSKSLATPPKRIKSDATSTRDRNNSHTHYTRGPTLRRGPQAYSSSCRRFVTGNARDPPYHHRREEVRYVSTARTSRNNVNYPPEQTTITDLRGFHDFWKKLFAQLKLLESNPRTATRREEMLSHIMDCMSSSRNSFNHSYWQEFLAYQLYLRDLKEVVKDSYYRAGLFSRITDIQKLVLNRIKKTGEINGHNHKE